MFAHLLYFNKERIIEYNSMVSEEQLFEINDITITKERNAGVDIRALKGDKKTTENFSGKVFTNNMQIYNKFISNIKNNDMFVDFLDNPQLSLDSLSRGNIILTEGQITIPDKFDAISLLNAIPQHMITEQIVREIDENERDLFKAFFKMENAKMPLIIEAEDKLLCAKLHSDNFTCTNEEFEEYIDEELVILAKVISPKKSKKKEIFNPLSDFIVLNRACRRSMENEGLPEDLQKIFVEEDYVNVEVLAIYQ